VASRKAAEPTTAWCDSLVDAGSQGTLGRGVSAVDNDRDGKSSGVLELNARELCLAPGESRRHSPKSESTPASQAPNAGCNRKVAARAAPPAGLTGEAWAERVQKELKEKYALPEPDPENAPLRPGKRTRTHPVELRHG
jgi:hypothetical protein